MAENTSTSDSIRWAYCVFWDGSIFGGSFPRKTSDECHLLWGDICGYIWGQTKYWIEVPVINEKQRQTSEGALNYYTQEFLVKPYNKGDSTNTIAFIEYLISQSPKSRLAIIWDGASYHRNFCGGVLRPQIIPCSAEFKAYLDAINQNLSEDEWKITCIRFAPNDPTQNPVEDIWLYAKKFVREFYHLCKSFSHVKRLFELVSNHQIFNFSKMFMYDSPFLQFI